jgi:RNA polymerase sigma-70 factor (ECF subfamily)
VWSIVNAAKSQGSPKRLAAANRCIAGYWKPVFYFLRARGYSFHDAEDMTQDFFTRFLDRDWIRAADGNRGRFRTFLLTILTRFVADQGPRRAKKQQTFDRHLVPISALVGDDERSYEPPTTETPDAIFMKQWAKAVIGQVQSELRAWAESKGRPDWHSIFDAHHFPPPGEPRPSQQALATKFAVTREQVKYAIEQMDAQFVETLRTVVVDQTGGGDVDVEICELERLLAE